MMTGLLDGFLASLGQPGSAEYGATNLLAQGLLGGRGGGMQRLAGGLGASEAYMAQARQQEEEKKRRALQEQMLMQQLEAAKAQQAERAAAQAKERGIDDAFRGAFRSGDQRAMAAYGGPTNRAAEAGANLPGQIDQQALIRNLMQADPRMAAQMATPKPRKIARTVDVEGPNGEKLVQQFDEEGNAVGQPVPGYTAPTGVNLGNRYEFLKPRAGVSAAMGQSPDSKASNAIGWANVANARDRLALDRSNAAPVKLTATQERAQAEKDKAGRQGEQMMSAITEAKSLLGSSPTESGIGAGVDWLGRQFGGSTDGAKVAAKLETLSGWMVANVPRMEGPQSNFDVDNYKTMAAMVGDRTRPVSERLAALSTLEKLQRKYAEINGTPLPDMPSAGVNSSAGVPSIDLGGGFTLKGGR